MGLVFAIQPDLRRSSESTLVISSSKRRFGLGTSFLFGAALLGTMYLAASPLFKLLWTEGAFFDQALAALIFLPIPFYPLLALSCWFFKEVVIVKKQKDGPTTLEAYQDLLGYRWGKQNVHDFQVSNLYIDNWKGAINTAAVEANRKGTENRYATKGHWMLRYKENSRDFQIERRAKRDEVELLKAQIEAFLKAP